MHIGLCLHPQGYSLPGYEDLFTMGTQFSGAPFAQRHWDLASLPETADFKWGHRVLAVVESLPVIGLLAVLIERVAACIFDTCVNKKTSNEARNEPSQPNSSSVIAQSDDTAEIPMTHKRKTKKTKEPPSISSKLDQPTQTTPQQVPASTGPVEANSGSTGSDLAILNQEAQELIEGQNELSHTIEVFIQNLIELDLKTAPLLQPGQITLEDSYRKMWRNSQKAIEEHRKQDAKTYANEQESLPALEAIQQTRENSQTLKMTSMAAEDIGTRRSMEDAHFYFETERGAFAGVLDGHGGIEVANFTKKYFIEKFEETLKKNEGHVHRTFYQLMKGVHEEVIKNTGWNLTGTTAVVCYVDKITHLIYTASVGDSEANIYRLMNGEMKSIPLSCLRNWTSIKDARRAARSLNNPDIVKMWTKSTNPKSVRYPSHWEGVNVSRAIGDARYAGTPEVPAVSHKPKITVNKLQPGDILLLCCDGIKDFVSERKIADQISQYKSGSSIQNLAQQLIDVAKGPSMDNMTAVVVNIAV